MNLVDNVNPSHYRGFSNGAEVIDISENLTANGAQALQYVARATRADIEQRKGDSLDESIEDLHKAIWFLRREIHRFEEMK